MYKVILALLLAPCVLLGQDFKLRLDASLLGSQVSGDYLAGFNKIGFSGGVGIERQLSKLLRVNTAIWFTQKGSRSETNPTSIDYYVMRLNYLEIPLIINCSLINKTSLTSGISTGVLVNSSEQTAFGKFKGGDFTALDLNFLLGIEYQLSEKVALTFTYGQSLLPIREIAGTSINIFAGNDQYNSWLKLGFARILIGQ